ncbi:MAG TPA: hypothetical protein VE093_43250 [Polyangiaceae bacterium]|jgi:hypothetical protein|nr:hypothetical protein [Polyangiaceae bacterium]
MGTPCQQFCELRAPVCPDDDDSTCLEKCDFEYDKGVCKAEWAAAIDCVLTSGELVCNNGSPKVADACDQAFVTYVACLVTSCYKDLGACNPLLDSCPEGRVCDPGDGAFYCRSASSPVPRGEDCDNSPACEHGTTCFFGRCTAFCCSDSDCGFGSCKYQATLSGPEGDIPLMLCDPS